MRWVAPTEKDTANQTLEKRLWDAADQFRANSGLKAGQYFPRAYTKETYQTKCNVLFEHVYESYMGDGKSSYTEAA